MDLGYSSSDSESESNHNNSKDNKVLTQKRTLDETVNKEDQLDITGIFDLEKCDDAPRFKRQHKIESISMAIKKALDDKIESCDDQTQEDLKITAETAVEEEKTTLLSKIPKNAEVQELDMNVFYKNNQESTRAGELDGGKKSNTGKITLHRGAGGVGSLKDVIRFNLKNEEKITYQNKERIAREKELARNKANV